MKKMVCLFLCLAMVLSLFVTPASAGATRYEAESNNTMSTANVIYDDDTLYGRITTASDVDYYKVKFTLSGNANFWLGDIPSGKDYDLYVYNDSGALLGAPCLAGNAGELVSNYPVVANKWYYLKVVGYNCSDSTNYYQVRAKNYPAHVRFENEIYSIATNTNGMTRPNLNSTYGASIPNAEWCGYYAEFVLKKAYAAAGVSDPFSAGYLPKSTMQSATLTANTWKSGKYGTYYQWVDTWTYSGRTASKTTNTASYTPTVGDIVLVENNGNWKDGPDHIAIIISTRGSNAFTTAEGNVGDSNNDNSKVKQITYTRSSSSGIFMKEGSSSVYACAICHVKAPYSSTGGPGAGSASLN